MNRQIADMNMLVLFFNSHQDYLKSLIEVMNTAEDLESLENLHALCSIMQTIREYYRALPLTQMLIDDIYSVMLNDHTMYEHILEDDIFFGVVGMLECPSRSSSTCLF